MNAQFVCCCRAAGVCWGRCPSTIDRSRRVVRLFQGSPDSGGVRPRQRGGIPRAKPKKSLLFEVQLSCWSERLCDISGLRFGTPTAPHRRATFRARPAMRESLGSPQLPRSGMTGSFRRVFGQHKHRAFGAAMLVCRSDIPAVRLRLLASTSQHYRETGATLDANRTPPRFSGSCHAVAPPALLRIFAGRNRRVSTQVKTSTPGSCSGSDPIIFPISGYVSCSVT